MNNHLWNCPCDDVRQRFSGELATFSERKMFIVRSRIRLSTQSPELWLHDLGKVREDARVDGVGLASLPLARAKSRTCRGLTTITGKPAAASSLTAANSNPPLASSTMPSALNFLSRRTSWAIPRALFATSNTSSPGRSATSSRCFDTSIPTKTMVFSLPAAHPCAMRALNGPSDRSG